MNFYLIVLASIFSYGVIGSLLSTYLRPRYVRHVRHVNRHLVNIAKQINAGEVVFWSNYIKVLWIIAVPALLFFESVDRQVQEELDNADGNANSDPKHQ